MDVRILKRDNYGRTIQVGCPRCSEPAILDDKSAENLENNLEIRMACKCGDQYDVSAGQLVLDGVLEIVRLAPEQRYVVSYKPSSGPTGGTLQMYHSVELLDVHLQTLGVPQAICLKAIMDLRNHSVAIEVRLKLHRLKSAALI
jgi:hypothetical protein